MEFNKKTTTKPFSSFVRMENSIDRVLHGQLLLANLPPIEPRAIRIFICAPFSDTFEEQNELNINVYPRLREFCMSRYGLEFQAIDMHWGLKENNIDDKYFITNCLKEINNCSSQSIGPTFLALIGDVYGKPILPLSIERILFENVIKCLYASKIDFSLLKKFYVLNINCLINQYELCITDEFNIEEEDKILDILKNGYELAAIKGLIKQEDLAVLNASVLQKLLDNGSFDVNDKTEKVFCFVRINEECIDIDPCLERLREKDTNKYIPSEQIYRIRSSNGQDKIGYLKNFGEHYLKTFKILIDRSVQKNPEHTYSATHQDILHHFHFIKNNICDDLLVGGERAIKDIRDYIYNTDFRQPVILCGPVGCGKTSCLASITSTLFLQFNANEKNLQNVSNKSDAIIFRFIGADRKSLDLRNLLKSICLQLRSIYFQPNSNSKKESPEDGSAIPSRLCDLKRYFKTFLTQTVYKEEGRLILVIDSLQDLAYTEHAYKLDWLPQFLKPNCKLILSVSSDHTALMNRLKNKYTNQRSYIYLENLNTDQAEFVIKKYLEKNNYRLEDRQIEVLKHFTKYSKILSLHLKLLSKEFLSWKSYTPIDECILKCTLNEAIIYLISKLECKFGVILVKYVLSYITASKTGLSELELQDILSLDNKLLSEINDNFKQSSNIVRVPWFYILPIIHDLERHLIKRLDNGLYVLYWRHNLFTKIIKERYIDNDIDFEKQLHTNISEYFLGLWADPNLKDLDYDEIYEIVEENSVRFSNFTHNKPLKRINTVKTNRLCAAQPMRYESFHTNIEARYNLRKLNMLPYHLIKAVMIEQLFNEIYFNVEWMYAKICAFDLQTLIYDFDLYKENLEVNLVNETLKLSEAAIISNKNLLFVELTGRLFPYRDLYNNINSIIKQCDLLALNHNPIIPFGQIYKAPSWILHESFKLGIEINDNLQMDIVGENSDDQILILKNTDSYMAKIFDLNLMEPRNDVYIDRNIAYCSRDAKFICTLDKSPKLILKRIENGEFYSEVRLLSVEIGHVYLSNKYASITYRKASSPVIIDLNMAKIIKTLLYQCCFSCISPDDEILLAHSEDKLYYHKLPNLERIITLPSREIPDRILFAEKNTKFYVLTRSTKQITYYFIILEKKHYQTVSVIQDNDIYDFKLSPDENMLLVCTKKCIYVIDTKTNEFDVLYKIKPHLPTERLDVRETSASTLSRAESFVTFENSLIESTNNNIFTGFGVTSNNQIIYATYYTYLFCWNASNGTLLRIFQSTLSANRIIKSCSSVRLDCIVSLLDDNSMICWNLKNVDKKMSFENMLIHNCEIVNCLLPKIPFQSQFNSSLLLSYCSQSPDIKIHSLKNSACVQSILNSYYDDKRDDSLSSRIDSICVDDTGRFCFIVLDTENFMGKRLNEDMCFMQKVGSLIDLHNEFITMEKFTYIVQKYSRFELKAQFLNRTEKDIYLAIQITSCINDFDPFNKNNYDWTEFETHVRVYGPIKYKRDENENERLPLFDEFKPYGEPLINELCITKNFIYASLMHECHKLTDKDQPYIIKAKRYDVHLNIYDLFEYKKSNTKIQLFDLNEFLKSDQYAYENVLLDVKPVYNNTLLILYSKEGISQETTSSGFKTTSNTYKYDYKSFRFQRDIRTCKGGIIYDPIKNIVLKRFPIIFTNLTNVDQIIISDSHYIIDNLWNVYDLRNGNLLHNICKNNVLDLAYKYIKFLLNGRYILTSNNLENKIYLIRCYDSKIVASFFLYDRISCLCVGEDDRTIVAGTKNGILVCFKLLIDLEKYEAVNKYIEAIRNTIGNTIGNQTKSSDKEINKITSSSESSFETLNFDLKRVVNSSHEHKRLKSRESSSRSKSRCSSVFSSSSGLGNIENYDISITKKSELANLTRGIKYAPLSSTSSRACLIQ